MSTTKRCDSGHYYNPSQHASCPFCRGISSGVGDTQGIPGKSKASGHLGDTRGIFGASGPSLQADAPVVQPPPLAGSTMGVKAYQAKGDEGPSAAPTANLRPVVGWLVCTVGGARGQDFRVVQGQNRVGREPHLNDIAVPGDELISRDFHCEVFFDHKHAVFYLMNRNGRNGTYLNDMPVLNNERLKAGDRIELGETELTFVPFCGPEFRWE